MDKLKEMPLASQHCRSCKLITDPLESGQCKSLMDQLCPEWTIDDGKLEREFKFKNFRQALAMTNEIGQLAEQQGHHPDIFLAWGTVKITLFTHKVNGLTNEDFILAAKIDQLQ
jgi:4a-hydroxytetrahydrobiopterin dehydratase